ncbi:Bacillibactin transport regulator [Chryseobacterium nakagawai]|uniref:Helix-turn-helix domain-containing protein n=1 Tax=Chryseobacterium nakagawai TaxID=1241982 RepID=A0AAD1DTG0_CHRNA|nr:AraC family transcriptional regulator [Chryseobacterium nakagawai]AZA92929.1 helix-turn-helix domain-containing protein [Chryseobacterium nakagawai]VEH19551.1 Bacillibactin transport regulator [Chryseobacterium nakagawai]
MKDIPVRNINQQDEPQLSSSYSIRDIAPLLAENDMVQELHRHDFFYILIIKKGSGEHEIDFTHYNIQEHTVFVMRPGQVHRLSLKIKGTGYLIQFKTDFLYSHNSASQNHLTKLIQYNRYQLEPGGFTKIENIVLNALKEYSEKEKGYQEVLKANLSIFLIELLRQRQDKVTTPVASTPYIQEKLEQFLELIETNITTHKQVSQYADWLYLSPYQLSTITKSLLNKTPSEVINDSIILEAKRQLLATSNQISQIAYNLGYEDPSYFTRFFKKHTTVSPEMYRQNFR